MRAESKQGWEAMSPSDRCKSLRTAGSHDVREERKGKKFPRDTCRLMFQLLRQTVKGPSKREVITGASVT